MVPAGEGGLRTGGGRIGSHASRGRVAPPSSPPGLAASAVSVVTTAPVEEEAGAVVVLEPGGVAVVDDGRVVAVDRPEPPEDGRDVLVVELPGLDVEVEGEVVVGAPALSSAGTVVVVGEGSVVVVVVVVKSGDGSVVGVVGVVSTVVDVVASPPPGSASPRSAGAGAAGTQKATATSNVVRALARRTGLSITSPSEGGTATL